MKYIMTFMVGVMFTTVILAFHAKSAPIITIAHNNWSIMDTLGRSGDTLIITKK